MFLEIEPSANLDKNFSMVYQDVSHPREIFCIKYQTPRGDSPVQVTGWDAETNLPCPAYACHVEESGDGIALLIFGGTGGLRLKELEDDSEWNAMNPRQWSETHLIYPRESFVVYKDEI